MKFGKITAAALAALSFGTLSAAACAEEAARETDKYGFELRGESNYKITLEKAEVNGKERTAVTLSGLPNEMLTHKYDLDVVSGYKYINEYRNLTYLAAAIDVGDEILCFYRAAGSADFKCCIAKPQQNGGGTESAYYGAIEDAASNSGAAEATLKTADTTFALTAYLESDSEISKKLSSGDTAAVLASAVVSGGCTYEHTVGDKTYSGRVIKISSDGTVEDPGLVYNDEGKFLDYETVDYKERTKITDNRSAAENDAPAAPGGSDKKPDVSDAANAGGDQKPTGIALAIAPVVLAAGAVIAISKKRNK